MLATPLFVLALAGFIAAVTPAAVKAETSVPDHVGSAACASCHEAEYALWQGSHHRWAWTLPSPETVLGDFDDTEFTHAGVTTRFHRDGDAYLVETDDGTGAVRTFEIVGVAGVAPLQQYLIEVEPGRIQTLDVAWDVGAERWYQVFPEHVLVGPGDGLHWTGPYKSWNARCAECHATDYRRNYDFPTRSYQPEAAEIGVGCEACHGPGSAHVAWAALPDGFDPGAWKGVGETGLVVDLAASAEAEITQCAPCHSRREAFSDGLPPAGAAYHDNYRLSLLREGLYHPDGQIQDEVYVYGSFLQSRMYDQGVRCSDCHEPHGAALRAEGDAVCTQCHNPAGNPRFASLTGGLYADPSHHFHPQDSEGARCASCHMIERVYMGIDGRRDHGFRIPRPDLSVVTGAPNACTDCHQDRDAAWAAAEVEARFPDSPHRGGSFSTTFAAARRDPSSQIMALVGLADRQDLPGIVRATALDLLQPVASEGLAARIAPLLADDDPLVRTAAAELQRPLPPAKRGELLLPALRDPLRAVRIAAARAMLGAGPNDVSPEVGTATAAALAEWQQAQFANADFPEAHMSIGGVALQLRNVRAAEEAFGEAVRLDPQLVDGWVMIARIRAAIGQREGAGEAIAEGLAANPNHPALLSTAAELGLPVVR